MKKYSYKIIKQIYEELKVENFTDIYKKYKIKENILYYHFGLYNFRIGKEGGRGRSKEEILEMYNYYITNGCSKSCQKYGLSRQRFEQIFKKYNLIFKKVIWTKERVLEILDWIKKKGYFKNIKLFFGEKYPYSSFINGINEYNLKKNILKLLE